MASSLRVDETYIKVQGKWMYQYRAVDKGEQTINCYFQNSRNQKAATKFLVNSMCSAGKPQKVNVEKSVVNTAPLKKINKHL